MYQFFVEEPLEVGKHIVLSKEQSHHALSVLRLHHETVRLVHEGKAYYGDGYSEGKLFSVDVLEEDTKVTELPYSLTLMMALIRREKMELVLQKATELGVTKIIPFESSRCVVHHSEEKSSKSKERWNSILVEASAQCKRNRIPELSDTVKFKDLIKFKEASNYIAYENADMKGNEFGRDLPNDSISIVIGPEGGFSEEEVQQLLDAGFKLTSLGNRILRAETAAIYALSIASNHLEK